MMKAAKTIWTSRIERRYIRPSTAQRSSFVTTGTNWRFLRLEGAVAKIDIREYYLQEIGRILGILCDVVRRAMAAPP
jgi:hypothetical protein